MAAEKNRQGNPHDADFFDDLTERVFKDYEPPGKKDSVDKSEDESTEDDNENQQAA